MKTYTADGLQDLALHKWWVTMVLSGDLQRGYGPHMDKLSSFFSTMQAPTELIYEEDESGIWFAMWLDPQGWGAGYVHVWVAAAERPTKKAVRAVIMGLTHYLERYPVLIGVTQLEAVALEHEKFGFRRLGEVPMILDGETAYITVVTREAFAAATARFHPLMHEAEARDG